MIYKKDKCCVSEKSVHVLARTAKMLERAYAGSGIGRGAKLTMCSNLISNKKIYFLASGNKHAKDKIAAELCIHAFYLAINVACGATCSFPGAK